MPVAAHTLSALGPNALISALGLLRGPERTVPAPDEDWRLAVVDVVIHTRGHQHDIAYCLASLLAQDHPVRRLVLIDDGGALGDHAVQIASEFALANAMPLEVIERKWSLGRAPTLKRQAREMDCDVLFVIDGDVVLESPDYIRRCVQTLYEGAGIASVAGTSRPMRARDRRRWATGDGFRRWVASDPYIDPRLRGDRWHRLTTWLAAAFHESTGRFQQGFLDRGQMALFGGIAVSHGRATAYRRGYLKDVFDRFEPIYGDALTGMPDLFVAMALNNEGYRNVRLADVHAHAPVRSLEQLPLRHGRATSAYMQSCVEFDALLRSPFKWPRRLWRRWRASARGTPDARRVVEAYRQPFGERLTREQGRPIGWAQAAAALDKVLVPALAVALVALGMAGAALGLLLVDAVVWVAVVAATATGGERMRVLGRALASTPLRSLLMFADLLTVVAGMLRLAPAPLRLRRAG
ncbi:glycosyltransferase family A protein [Marilutibacter maris]|uniref:Glycosyl transferase family 2 n=1 Tax=Marilutibacter maris TaxID=1605891 RepID=A0A2U9TCR8_9GAMM|nr:glycosyltransferase family 2 protein [Lysobacter maris]AWV06040.1 glycosyl transferase family 2 [Lysobacter maris]